MGSEVLPCYLVCDISCSMNDHVEDLNAGLREFRGAVHAEPSVAARILVCVLGFAAVPRVQQALRPAVELTELTDLTGLTGPEPTGGSVFGSAFALLRATIDSDVRRLRGIWTLVSRPLVFFVSDGRPTDPDWSTAFADLTDPAWSGRPDVIAFGVGAVDSTTMGAIGTSRLFVGQDGVRIGTALTASVMRAVGLRT